MDITDLGNCRITIKQLHSVTRFLMNSKKDSISLKLFISLLSDGEDEKQNVAEVLEVRQEMKEEILNQSIEDWARSNALSVRVRKAIMLWRISTVKELTNFTEIELLARRNFGERSLNEIKETLAKSGLRLKSCP